MTRPLYELLYNATLEWHAGFVFCLASVLNASEVAVVALVQGCLLRPPPA